MPYSNGVMSMPFLVNSSRNVILLQASGAEWTEKLALSLLSSLASRRCINPGMAREQAVVKLDLPASDAGDVRKSARLSGP